MADFTEDFELVPPDDEEFFAADNPADLLDPGATDDEGEDALPIGKNWLMDFADQAAGHRPGEGRPQPVYGALSVVQVAQVALRTKRGEHMMFPPDFGMSNPDALLGHMDNPERTAAYMRDMQETLMACHERITSVDDFLFIKDDEDEIAWVDLSIEIDGSDSERIEGIPILGGI